MNLTPFTKSPSTAEKNTKANNKTSKAGISLITVFSKPDFTPLETTTAVIIENIVCQAKSLSGSEIKFSKTKAEQL